MEAGFSGIISKHKKMKIATVCSGIGSPEVALKNLKIDHEISFACEIDKFARQTYLANHNPLLMLEDMTIESWEGKEFYSDLFIGGIPCQSFSLAGKRLGELDPRGLLFFDFLRYVKIQNPKYFIIENVKGLISDNNGETFQNWIHLLGSSLNGTKFFFPHEDSVNYNLHFQVLNAKNHGLPHNRERVFLVGIRCDLENNFSFPKKRKHCSILKNIIEKNVHQKYYLSEKTIKSHIKHEENHKKKGNGFSFNPIELNENSIVNCISTKYGSRTTDSFLKVYENEVLKIRKFTPLECFRLQGFPDDFIKDVSDSQLYKQAGNTIAVNVIQDILKNLLK